MEKLDAEILLLKQKVASLEKFNKINKLDNNKQAISKNEFDHKPTESFEELRKEFKEFKKRLETLEKQNEVNQFKTFRDVKAEFKAFVTTNGYSKLLGTKSFFKKILWLICVVPLFGYCMMIVRENLQGYQEYSVITQIKVKDEDTMIFPAITFCLQEYLPKSDQLLSHNLTHAFHRCSFEGKKCSLNDFMYFQVDDYSHCYQFNGGRNATNHEIGIYNISEFGYKHGLTLILNFTETEYILCFVGDNKVRPVDSEINEISFQAGTYVQVGIKKTTDTKLPSPYSDCIENINPDTSALVKEIIQQNITYRKANCYELCKQEHQQVDYSEYPFTYDDICSHLCPLECNTNSFDMNEKYYSFEHIEDYKNLLWMNFYFPNNKYTELTQSVKITGASLIANTGGVLGLFLELSFISVYRFLVFLSDILFG